MLSYNKIVENKERLTQEAKMEAKNYKVFFFSAPYDKENTGDGDFVNAMIEANKKIGIDSTWIQGTNTLKSGDRLYRSAIDILQTDLPLEFQDKTASTHADLLKKLSEQGSRDFQDPLKFQQMVEIVDKNAERNNSILNIIKYIKENTEPHQQPILALQFRPPETGCFLTPQDLSIIRSAGIRVNITVHEYGLNYTRPHLQAYSHEFFEQADHVFFLNKQDKDAAVESTKRGKLYDAEGAVEKFSKEKLPLKDELPIPYYDLESKSSFTQVPPTVKVSTDTIENSLQRKPNISWFGMIRPWKGIEQAIEIATLMQAKQMMGTPVEKEILNGAKVIIAGLPAVNKTMLDLFTAAFKLDATEAQQLKAEYEKIEASQPKSAAPPSDAWTNWWKIKLDEFKTQGRPDLPPVEIYLNVDMEQNINLHKECLYAYKPDSKGLAGNSSSIISEMAQKCITITKWGYCTPVEFLAGGQYEGALILSPHIHGDSATPDLSNPYYKQDVGSPTPRAVLQEILERQRELKLYMSEGRIEQSKNYQSLQRTENALNEFFSPTVIALQNAVPFMPHLLQEKITSLEEQTASHRAKPFILQKEIYDERHEKEITLPMPGQEKQDTPETTTQEPEKKHKPNPTNTA
jgi:hypothetical protein